MKPVVPRHLLMFPGLVRSFLTDLPSDFEDAPATWAWVSYNDPSVAVLTGSFNRSVFDAPFESVTSDPGLQEVYVNPVA